jgi:imidazolonepropionase-like amidohydrolase
MARLAEISRGNASSHAGALAITHATLIDTADNAPVPGTTVVTENGLITAVGPDNKIKIPKHARVVDAHGMSLLPGLWDMHAHFEQVEWGPLYLAAGVTTVRDCGNEIEFITAVRDAIAGGQGLGPRLLLAGIVDGNSPFALGVIRADNAEQAKAVVDRYHDLNFQQMKIYSSVKPEVVAAVAAEAHRLGMSVTGHIPEGMNAFQGVEAGMDQINHVQYIQDIMLPPLPNDAKRADRMAALSNLNLTSPESLHAIDFLKSHGTVVDDTLTVFEMVLSSSKYPLSASEPGIAKVAPQLAVQFQGLGVPDSFADKAHAIFEKEVGIVGALHRAGIPIVAGTDQTVPGYSVYREMELYVQAGFNPMEALQAATLVPARVMHQEGNSGSVAVGKRADLILVDGNPLENISNIRKVKYTIAGGALYESAPLWRSIDFQP